MRSLEVTDVSLLHLESFNVVAFVIDAQRESSTSQRMFREILNYVLALQLTGKIYFHF